MRKRRTMLAVFGRLAVPQQLPPWTVERPCLFTRLVLFKASLSLPRSGLLIARASTGVRPAHLLYCAALLQRCSDIHPPVLVMLTSGYGPPPRPIDRRWRRRRSRNSWTLSLTSAPS